MDSSVSFTPCSVFDSCGRNLPNGADCHHEPNPDADRILLLRDLCDTSVLQGDKAAREKPVDDGEGNDTCF